MAHYSIKEIEHLSGLKAHTLRIWEQRYSIIKPRRTATNIRYYTDEDLKLILNISILNKNGYRIGKIAKMSPNDISEQVNSLSAPEVQNELNINALTTSMVEIDEERFEKIMSTCILQHGLENTMINIINPFLEKIGIMWMTGSINPAQEHFITNLIRQKIIVAIDGQYHTPKVHSKHFLLFLPEGEMHELNLLFLSYLLKLNDHKVTYLGSSVPLKDVLEVSEYVDPDYFFTICTSSPSTSGLPKFLEKLCNATEQSKVFASGYRIDRAKGPLPDKVTHVKSVDHLHVILDAMKN